MANLGPLQQNLTYGNLLQVDGGLGAALKPVLDGDGNESGLSLSLTGVGISGLVADSASNLYSGSAGALPYQVAANTTGFVSAGIAGQFLKSNGASAPAWTTIIPATIGALASDGSIPLTGDLSMGFHKITNLLTPSNSNDAATKAYVDSLATGLQVKAACRLATTANISLSGATSVDGVTTSAGDRILVKSQTNPAQNGIYVASASAWTRATDTDTWAELVAAATFITDGSTLANTTWVSDTTPGGTLGTTAINFVLFGASAAYTAGIGLDLIGSQFSLEIPVEIANGGTGAITAEAALNNLLPDQADNEGKVLTTDGASVSWGSVAYDPSAVVITGGTIDGVSLGDTTPITSLTTSDAVDLSTYITVDPLVAAYLKSPRIWDATQTHWYGITPSELVANRNVTLPVLSANDTFVFNENQATLKNKTISGTDNVISDIENTSLVSSSITINGTPVDLGGSITVSGAISIFVSNITDLRAVNKATYQFAYVEGYYASGDGGGGNYYYDEADTTSADNGGTIIVATDGGRWKLSYQDSISIKQFGAKGDGTTNDAPAIQNAINWALLSQLSMLTAPAGIYVCQSSITASLTGIKSFSLMGSGTDTTQFYFNNNTNGFSFSLQAGNWWLNISPSSGLSFSNFSVITNASASSLRTGFYINGGADIGRPPKQITFSSISFRGNSDFSQGWGKCIDLYNAAAVYIDKCKFTMDFGATYVGIGINLSSSSASSPSGVYITQCEAFYGAIFVKTIEYYEGIYITSCSHVAGKQAIVASIPTFGESGLHVVNCHFNCNGTSCINLTNFDGFEILGCLFYSNGAGAIRQISLNSCASFTISGNCFQGDTSGLMDGVYVTNTPNVGRYGGTITGNNFSFFNNSAIYLTATAQRTYVGSNNYADVVSRVVDLRGNWAQTNNYSANKYINGTYVKTLTGGSVSETFNISIASGVFLVKPTSGFVSISDPASANVIATYDYGNVGSTATNVVITVKAISGTIPAGPYRFSVLIFE